MRYDPPTTIGNPSRKNPYGCRKQREQTATADQPDCRRSYLNDDESASRQGCQDRPKPQEPRQGPADRAKGLGYTDEAYKQSRQRNRAFEHYQRQHQLYSAGPKKE